MTVLVQTRATSKANGCVYAFGDIPGSRRSLTFPYGNNRLDTAAQSPEYSRTGIPANPEHQRSEQTAQPAFARPIIHRLTLCDLQTYTLTHGLIETHNSQVSVPVYSILSAS